MVNKNWFDRLPYIVIFTVLLGGFYIISIKIDRQAQKTDRLYEMFIDLLKEDHHSKKAE